MGKDDPTWLHKFLMLFQVAAVRVSGREQDLAALERELDAASRTMRLSRGDLRTLEKSKNWSYPKWWPYLSGDDAVNAGTKRRGLLVPKWLRRPSGDVDEDIVLPKNMEKPEAREKAVRTLYEHLKHIEVVSIVLRFMCPNEFGIISPPVISMLNLPPRPDHITTYLRYLETLRKIRDNYKDVNRVADVDMALWSAAHLALDEKYRALADEMAVDRYFQELRLRNLMSGLAHSSRWSHTRRLLVAEVLLEHDPDSASVIASREFERLVLRIATQLEVVPHPQDCETGVLVRMLNQHPELSPLKIERGALRRLWYLRNRAVHGNPDITKEEAAELVEGVESLRRKLRV